MMTMQRMYEAVLDPSRGIVVTCYEEVDGDLVESELDHPVALATAIRFALRCPTNRRGTRILSEGQSRVVSSILDARSDASVTEDQHAWEAAAAQAGETNADAGNVVRLRPRTH